VLGRRTLVDFSPSLSIFFKETWSKVYWCSLRNPIPSCLAKFLSIASSRWPLPRSLSNITKKSRWWHQIPRIFKPV